jgi:hypothetical protein
LDPIDSADSPTKPNAAVPAADSNQFARRALAGLIVLSLITLGVIWLKWPADPVAVAPPPPAAPTYTEYVVLPGDYLVKIADEHSVTLEALIEANAEVLAQNAKNCFRLDDDYVAGMRQVKVRGKVKTVPRPGYYCNTAKKLNGEPMFAPNSIKAGLKLRIPVPTVPVATNG